MHTLYTLCTAHPQNPSDQIHCDCRHAPACHHTHIYSLLHPPPLPHTVRHIEPRQVGQAGDVPAQHDHATPRRPFRALVPAWLNTITGCTPSLPTRPLCELVDLKHVKIQPELELFLRVMGIQRTLYVCRGGSLDMLEGGRAVSHHWMALLARDFGGASAECLDIAGSRLGPRLLVLVCGVLFCRAPGRAVKSDVHCIIMRKERRTAFGSMSISVNAGHSVCTGC